MVEFFSRHKRMLLALCATGLTIGVTVLLYRIDWYSLGEAVPPLALAEPSTNTLSLSSVSVNIRGQSLGETPVTLPPGKVLRVEVSVDASQDDWQHPIKGDPRNPMFLKSDRFIKNSQLPTCILAFDLLRRSSNAAGEAKVARSMQSARWISSRRLGYGGNFTTPMEAGTYELRVKAAQKRVSGRIPGDHEFHVLKSYILRIADQK